MKLFANPSVKKYLSASEVRSKVQSDVIYEVSGQTIKDCADGLFEAGKLRGWLYGAGAMAIAWAATEALDWLENKFKNDKG